MDGDFAFQSEELLWALSQLSEHASSGQDVLPRPPSFKLPSGLPVQGSGGAPALRHLAEGFFSSASRLGHPGYFAHMDPPTPWISWVGALWAASCNQNLLHQDTGSGARDLEEIVVGWLAPFFGMNGGHLVPGSTLANLTALWAARELRGVRRVVASEVAHLSIRKAASLLNLAFHEVPVDSGQRLRPEVVSGIDLSETAVVLTAGTAAAGAIDPLDAFPEAAWRHVDAAWAGPLRLTRHAGLLEGVQDADSVAVSAHKWLFQPKESALALFQEPEEAHQAMSFGGGYLAVPNVGLLGSHGARALPLAATLLAWGREGIAERVEHCMTLAERLASRIAQEPELALFGQPETGVVLWRPRHGSAEAVRARMQGAVVSLTQIGDEYWFRSVAANPNADADLIVNSALAALRSG